MGREGSKGGVRRLLSVDLFLLFAVLGVFFPWVMGPSISRSGLDQDGVGILALAASSYLLARGGVRWAWIPAGLGAVTAIRTVLNTLDAPPLTVGPGLWMSVMGLVVATVWLLGGELARIRETRTRSIGDKPAD